MGLQVCEDSFEDLPVSADRFRNQRFDIIELRDWSWEVVNSGDKAILRLSFHI